MQSITLTQDCSITIPVYGAKSFLKGATVDEYSPYYFPLINAGVTNLNPTPSTIFNTIVLQSTAGVTLSGHTIVRQTVAGAIPVDISSINATDKLYMTLNASLAGTVAQLHAYGMASDPSWNWTPGALWLSSNSTLTQIMPSTGYQIRLGTAITPQSIFFDPQPALLLA